MSQYSASLDLSTLSPAQGFALVGGATDEVGRSVAGAGDLNGDGFGDLIVGSPASDNNGASNSGSSFILFGGPAVQGATSIPAASLNGRNGFRVDGESVGQLVGQNVHGAGDLNGDGLADVVINGKNAAPTYVVFGQAKPYAAVQNVHDLDGADGFKVITHGATSAKAAGDFNGDGVDDLLVNGFNNSASVVFGHSGAAAAAIDVNTMSPDQGVRVTGDQYSEFGRSVAAVGDVNGDGFDDILVGAPGGQKPTGIYSYYTYYPYFYDSPGRAYLLFGSASGGAPARTTFLQSEGGVDLGHSVRSLGDFNGDGLGDFYLSGVTGSADNVIFGKAGGFGDTVDLDTDTVAGFRLNLSDGTSIDAAGDINGDGLGDIVLGAPFSDTPQADSGQAYVIFGVQGGLDASFDVSQLNGENGFVIGGLGADAEVGYSVSAAGDINGDGLDDLLVGAPGVDAAYVIYGQLPDEAVRRVGTAASQTLVGGNDRDRLLGVSGDDELYGNGGRDRLNGGAGKDMLIGGGGADELTGGSRKDTFVFWSTSDSPSGGADTITDLSDSDDRINLSKIDADILHPGDQAFVQVSAFTGQAGQLLVAYNATGDYAGYTTIQGDVNGDKVADLTILAAGDHHDFSRFSY